MAKVSTWSAEEVAQWIGHRLLLPYSEVFRRNRVSGEKLLKLGEVELRAMGLENPAHIIRLLSHIAVFRVQLGLAPLTFNDEFVENSPPCITRCVAELVPQGSGAGTPTSLVIFPSPMLTPRHGNAADANRSDSRQHGHSSPSTPRGAQSVETVFIYSASDAQSVPAMDFKTNLFAGLSRRAAAKRKPVVSRQVTRKPQSSGFLQGGSGGLVGRSTPSSASADIKQELQATSVFEPLARSGSLAQVAALRERGQPSRSPPARSSSPGYRHAESTAETTRAKVGEPLSRSPASRRDCSRSSRSSRSVSASRRLQALDIEKMLLNLKRGGGLNGHVPWRSPRLSHSRLLNGEGGGVGAACDQSLPSTASVHSSSSPAAVDRGTVYSMIGMVHRGAAFPKTRRECLVMNESRSVSSDAVGSSRSLDYAPVLSTLSAKGAAPFPKAARTNNHLRDKADEPGAGCYDPFPSFGAEALRNRAKSTPKGHGFAPTTSARRDATWLWQPDYVLGPGPTTYNPQPHVLSTFSSKAPKSE